jgi:hypothetical protein
LAEPARSATAHELAVIENMARDDPTPIEEAARWRSFTTPARSARPRSAAGVGRSRDAISNPPDGRRLHIRRVPAQRRRLSATGGGMDFGII